MRIDINYLCEEIHKAIRKHQILTEGRQAKNRNAAKNYIMQQLGYSESGAMKFIGQLKVKIPSVRLQQEKFLLGVARLFIDGDLSVNDDFKCTNFNQTLKLIASDAHVNEYDNNLNGMSADELINRFKNLRVSELSKRKELMGGKRYQQNREYTIVPINSFEEATKYAKYNEWCVTYSEDMFDDKTCYGAGRFYFCLRNGFENVPKKVGPNAPLDAYGLSMIAVSITMEGEPNSITCRWNHDNGGSDTVMDDEQLSELLGVNFYSVFKPYTREELHAKGVILFDEVQEMLDKGVSPNDIFELVGDFNDGYAKVNLNGKWNFINRNNKLLSDTWYDGVKDFFDGCACVMLGDKVNFIDTYGELISDTWFDGVDNFHNGYVRVLLNNKWNFIDTHGKLLSDTWYDGVDDFYNGYAKVRLGIKWNFIDKNGKCISDTWFDAVYDFYNGYAKVKLNGKWNFINRNNKLLSDTWFDDVYNFSDGYARVKLNRKWNFINRNNKLLSDTWFDGVYNFSDGYAKVELDDKLNLIDRNGKRVSNTWYDWVDDFHDGYARVKLYDKWNLLQTNGKLLSDTWFDEVGDFYDGYAEVKLNDKYFKIDKNGQRVSGM